MAFIAGDLDQHKDLAKKFDELQKKHADKGFKAYLVYTATEEVKPKLEAFAKELELTVPVAYLRSATEHRRYNVNPEAKNTVMTHRRNRILSNFVNVSTTEELAKVEAAVDEMLAAVPGS